MTTTINKSRVMNRAWAIFKGNTPYSYSFSVALRRSWEIEKANAEYLERKARMAAFEGITDTCGQMMAGCSEYYNNAQRGQYFGD